MPWHVVRTPAHGAADGAGRARRAHTYGHLPIGHDVTFRDAAHEAIDLTPKAQPLGASSLLAALGAATVSSQSLA